MRAEKHKTSKNEVNRLLENNFICEAIYLVWVYSPVLVPKSNKKRQTYQYFTDLNEACPRDSFLLLRIDQLVYVIA